MNYTVQIHTSVQAARLLRDHLDDLDHEQLWALYLDGQHRLINGQMLTKGTLTFTPIDARTVLKRALICDARAVILGHNHPSGNARPSASDIKHTDVIRKACDVFDIELVDHIIIAEDAYFSFADEIITKFNTLKQ
jgi:DNA repair protein RadC